MPGMNSNESLSDTLHKLVAVGAAAIEISAVSELLARLPEDFPAPILLAIHSVSRSQSASMAKTLASATKLPCDFAADGQAVPARGVLVAPPDRHMIVERSKVRVVFGPKENCHRPALDPLFRSAALSWGKSAVGVVLCGLTGSINDGLFGLQLLHERGGIVVVPHADGATPVQTSETSIFARVTADYMPAFNQLASLLPQLVSASQTPTAA